MKHKELTYDVIAFIVIVIFSISYSWIVQGELLRNPLAFATVTAFLSALYFGYRKKKNWQKIIVGSLVFGLLFGTILEFLANINQSWIVPFSIFPVKFLGVTPLEAIIGYIPMTFFVLVVYEHFFDKDVTHKISHRIWHVIIPVGIFLTAIIISYFIKPNLLMVPYFYLIVGIIAIVYPLLQMILYPILRIRYVKLITMLFFVFFAFEIVGVLFNYWIYPQGDYIGLVSIFGHSFPLEEIIFWMFFYPVTIVSYYESFVDDLK